MIKVLLKILLLIASAVYLVFAMTTLSKSQKEVVCNDIAYDIRFRDGQRTKQIVDIPFVTSLLKRNHIAPKGKSLGEINLTGIRQILEKNVYIDSAFCYYTAAGTLCVDVIPKKAVMKVITPTKEFYLTDGGSAMPVGEYQVAVPTVTGEISVARARRLRPLLEYIENSKWRKKTEGISLDAKEGLVLKMKDEPYDVAIGSEENYEEKLRKLDLFTEKVFSKTGKERYRRINVAFEGQVVGVKR